MTNYTRIFLVALFGMGLLKSEAQTRKLLPDASSLKLNGALTKLFVENQSFSATIIFERANLKHTNSLSGKICFDSGKIRIETSIVEMMGAATKPEMAAQIKSLGMDSSVIISRPDKKTSYILFPALKNYVENSAPEKSSVPALEDFTVKSEVLGKQMVDGFETIEKDVVVTGKNGERQKFRVWCAAELNDFPVMIETIEKDGWTTRRFNNVSLAKPAANLFEIPAGFTQNGNLQAILPSR